MSAGSAHGPSSAPRLRRRSRRRRPAPTLTPAPARPRFLRAGRRSASLPARSRDGWRRARPRPARWARRASGRSRNRAPSRAKRAGSHRCPGPRRSLPPEVRRPVPRPTVHAGRRPGPGSGPGATARHRRFDGRQGPRSRATRRRRRSSRRAAHNPTAVPAWPRCRPVGGWCIRRSCTNRAARGRRIGSRGRRPSAPPAGRP